MQKSKVLPALYSDANHKPLGFCLYCGGTKHLTNEHIWPRFLGGGWVLPKSSCEKCREITREFEEVCAREMIGAHRAQFGYRSSSGKPLSKELEFQVHKAGTVSKKKVEASGAPLVPVIAPFFPAPGILRRVPPSDEGEFRPWTCAVNQNEPDQKRRLEMIHQNQAELISFRVNFNPIIFMRVLAKIAHAGATRSGPSCPITF